jgi:hypothetical protein
MGNKAKQRAFMVNNKITIIMQVVAHTRKHTGIAFVTSVLTLNKIVKNCEETEGTIPNVDLSAASGDLSNTCQCIYIVTGLLKLWYKGC